MKSYLHNINSLALSIVLSAAIITQVEGFIATTPQNNNAQTVLSHQHTPCISLRTVPSILRATNDDNENEKEEELPKAGSFFNEVPTPKEESDNNDNDDTSIENEITSSSQPVTFSGDDTDMFEQIIKQTKLNTGGGFSKTTSTTTPSIIQSPSESNKSFVGIGKPLNDIQNPETDSKGYTIYTDETTGEKSRVFEALIEYPTIFKMKIVGRDPDEPDNFTPDIVNTVATSCGCDISMVKYTEKTKGKWISVTVHAPVRDADMLYMLYENVDKDPRVKFKF